MKKSNYFATANTGLGFVNHFENINAKQQGFQFILKGGAGTGKHTLMKKIGEHFLKQNFTVENFYCSSDSESLDCVRIVEKNISIVDGTAPHITEASLPNIHQKIVDLGAFISPKVKKFENNILHNLKNKKIFFDLLYKDLNIALILQNENMELLKTEFNLREIENKCKNITKYINLKNKDKMGTNRKLFLNTYGKDGFVSFMEKNDFNNIFETELNDFEKQKVFKKLTEIINLKGYNTTTFLNIINPNLIDQIFIEDINLLITNVNTFNMNIKTLEKNKKILNKFKNNHKLMQIFTKRAGNSLINAKYYHKQIEKYYIKNMDFVGVNILTENLIFEINSL